MRNIKTLLVAGMALLLSLAAFGNITMSDSAFGAIQTAVGMQGTFKHAMWRAIESPAIERLAATVSEPGAHQWFQRAPAAFAD